MRFGYLYQVPSVQVAADTFAPHFQEDTVVVPETITLNHVPGSVSAVITQQNLIDWTIQTTPAGLDNVMPTQLVLLASELTNDQLIAFGIEIGRNSPREIAIGQDMTINFDLSNFLVVNEAAFIGNTNQSPSGGQSLGIAFANPQGVQLSLTDSTGASYKVADSWICPKDNFTNDKFKTLMGYPTTALCVPTNPTAKTVVPNSSGPVQVQGVWIADWDLSGTHCVKTLPPVPLAADFEIVSQMDRSGTTDSKVGVSFSDTTATAPTTGGRGTELSQEMKHDDMNELPIDFSMIVDRYQWAANLDWTTASQTNSVLGSYRIPWSLLTSATNQSSFKSFVYWRGKVRIKIQLQSNMFQQGCIIAYFVPLTDKADIDRHIAGSRASQTVCPHVMLTAGASRNATLDIPFVHFLKRLDLGQEEVPNFDLGTLIISVFNPLETGPNASGSGLGAKISLFGSFPESNFQVLDPTGGAAIVSQGALSSKVTNVTNNISEVTGSTIDFANTTRDKMEGGASNSTDVSGMDKPNVGLNPTQVVRKKYPDFANACNVDQNQVLDLYPNRSQMLDNTELGVNVDEMHFDYLRKQTKSFMDTVLWKDTDGQGTTLYFGELTPCPKVISAASNSVFQPTLLEYTTLPFSLWRGGLKLTIQIVGSKVHTGRIVVCTHYGRTSQSIPFEQAMAQYAHVFNFSAEDNTFEVVFPWRSARQMLRVPSGNYPNLADFSMGEFSIRVINPLQTMESIASQVQMNLYWSAADDFETDFHGANSIDFKPVVYDDEVVLS
jgi:hypothetical protein